MKSLIASSLSALAASALFLAAGSTSANAADYTWDTVSGDGATITAASGTWNTTAGNTVWNSGTTNVIWAQTSGSAALHNAIFAGTDGTHTVTLSGSMNAQSVTFNNSGYTLAAGTLTLKPTTTTNGNITVAAGKTATISAPIAFTNNAPTTITSGSGSTLNLGGGASNSQYTFTGLGTVNMTGGAYQANVGKVNVATFNQTSGTFSMQPSGTNTGYSIGDNAGRSVAYTMSGSSIINFNAQAGGTNSFFAIGKSSGTTAYTNTLNVTGAANLNVGTTAARSGELQIGSTADSNGTLNVTGGAATVGTGKTDNKIYFFKNGSNAGYSANLTQSGGTVTANGIQFGGTAGTYNGTSSANLTLSGGVLYVGLQGITRTGSASALPTSIKLQGGAIGASDNWSSSLDMKLGTTSGGPVFQAATSGSASKNITLSGNLSDDDSVSGKLTKTGGGDLVLSGSNSYSGGTIINAGRVFINTPNSLPSSGAVTLNAAQLVLDASDSPTYSQNITINTGSNLAMRKAVTLSNVSLATSGTVIFNQNDQATQSFSLGSNVGLTGNLDVRVGGGVGTPGGVTLTGIISGSGGSLTKSGTGTLTLSGANTYTGATTVTTGTLALGANDVLPDATNVTIGSATLNAATFTDTAGTLSVTGSASINLGSGATLAFADSSAPTWSGALNITDTFVSGTSMRFGTTSGGLTATQLGQITSTGYNNFSLNENGFLTATPNTPTLISIVDNKYAGPIAAGTVVTYTVTFSQAMDAATITAEDFENAGDAGHTIGAVIGSGAVFTVQATATSAGTLILRIKDTASITNAIGNALVVPLSDDTIIVVNSSSAPALTAANIVDDKTGQLVSQNMPVTYTLNFSEDIDASTVTAADFENAGTAAITIGTITETSPGVFTVEVTPTGTGTLQLRIKANAEIRAEASGNVLDTTSAILDADTITVGSYLFWDAVGGDGATITSGTGAWDTTAQKWNNLITNVPWSQTSATDASNGAVFGGDDGTANEHVVTVTGTMAADSLTFNSSGYQITSGTVSVMPTGTTNGGITVAAGKTATISSKINYADNKAANITANSGATLNLGGGATNSQYSFTGAGIVNLNAGTYSADVGKVNVATFNQGGGTTFDMTLPEGTGGQYAIGFAAGRSVTYTLSGSATINANGNNASDVEAFLAIGRSANNTAYNNILNVTGSATLNVGTATRAGELLIASNANSNGTLNVTSGTVRVSGTASNKIYFFKAGSNAGYAANLTQSGGTITTNGIQFGGTATNYDGTSSANLTLSGSTAALYVGAQGITRGSGTSALPIAIKLQGGTIGASDSWSSSLDMKLGATSGGPVFQAATSGTVSKNITLSGVLSDDTSVSGKLTKTGPGTLTLSGTGANTYTGATAVNAGTLDLGKVDAVSSSSSLTIANGAGLALNSSSSTVPNLTFAGTGTLSFDAAAGLILTVNGTDGVTNSGAAGSITINITGAAPAAGTYTLIDYSGTLQGAGFSAYTLGSVPAGKNYALNDSGSAVELVVTSNYTWTGAVGSEWSTAAISGSKNWTKDGGAIDYADDLGAIFDSTATSFIVDISGANVSPLSVAFNSGSYTLQGTHTIAGPGSVTVASGATLKLGSSNKLPDGAGAGNVAINGTLDLNGYSDTVNGLTGSGSVDNTAAATTSTLTVGANAGGTFSGALKNTGGTLALTKTGGTDITLSGSNSYNGATTINQGRLFISSTNAFSPDTAVTVNNGAAFFLNATGTYAQSITLNSGANLSQRLAATLSNVTLPSSGSVIFNNDTLATQAFTLASAQTLGGSLNIQVGGSGTAATGAVTLSGALSGSGGSLVKSGTGTLALTGSNTFGGGVTISNGTLESRTTSTTLGSGTATMGGAGSKGATYLTGQPNSNRFVINAPDSGNIVIGANGAGSGFTMSGGITLNGNLTLQTFNNTVPIAPATTKATAILTGGVTGSGNLLLNNNGLAANNITISGSSVNHTGSITLQGTATGDTIISAPIGANVIGITQSSSTSLLVLSGSNSYASNLTINAGTVRISNNSNTANDVSTVSIASGGTLDLTYVGTDKVDKLVINGVDQPAGVYGPSATNIAQIIGTGTLTVGAPEIALEQPANTAIASGGSQDFGSVEVGSNTSLTFTIRNSGDLALNLTGTPAAAISGANEADFTVTANPITPVAAGGSTTFTVQFAPSAATARNATLTIANDDSDEGSFVINLTGTGTVSDPFAAWSGGATFDADANGDGVSNGLAWILGAANVSTNARSLLPTVSTTATHMVFTFKRIQASINASTALSVEVGTTLAAWSTYTVGDSDNVGSSPGVTIVKNSPSAGTDTVTVTVARGADAKKFVRLKAVLTP